MSNIHQHCFNVYVRVNSETGDILGTGVSDEEIDQRLFDEDAEMWLPLNEGMPWWAHDLAAADYLVSVLDFPKRCAVLFQENTRSDDSLDACEVTDRIAEKLQALGFDLEPHQHTMIPDGAFEIIDGGVALFFRCACGQRFTASVDCDEMEECA